MEILNRTDSTQYSDGVLVAATRRGDPDAFEKLVLRYEKRIFAVAQRITKNREDAEDIAQETFHKAFLHLDGFQEKSLFSTWLTRIAINQSLMLVRRRRRSESVEVPPVDSEDLVESISATFADRSPNPEESCWRRERTDLLAKAINQLGPVIRRTILLRDIEERSAKETAQLLDVTIPAVKSRVCRGRRELSGMVSHDLLATSLAW